MKQVVYQSKPGQPGVPVLVEPYVPLVHNWAGAALEWWTDFMYPPRRRLFVVWGIFFWVWLLWIATKSAVYFGGMALLTAIFVLTAAFDLATYPIRKHRATV